MSRVACLALLILTMGLVGCSKPNQDTPGYTKDDFAKKPIPAGFGPAHAGPPTVPSSVRN